MYVEDILGPLHVQGARFRKAPIQEGTRIYPLADIFDFQNQVAAASWAVNHRVFVNTPIPANATFAVGGVSLSFGTASTSGALQIEVTNGTTAVGAGTNQLTAPISASGAANATVNGAVIATPTPILAGGRVNLIWSGTVTGLADAIVGLSLVRLT